MQRSPSLSRPAEEAPARPLAGSASIKRSRALKALGVQVAASSMWPDGQINRLLAIWLPLSRRRPAKAAVALKLGFWL
jgi:hypothetical protein